MEYYEKVKSSFNLESINSVIENIFDNIYQTLLLPQLKEENNCISIKCPTLDFTQEVQDTVSDNLESTSLNNIYQTDLLSKLEGRTNCIKTECPIFDFTQETKDDLDNIITEKTNDIKKEISLIKGDNIEVNIKIQLEISFSEINILNQIYESFKEFLSFEKEEQASRINEFIQNVIKSNLDDFLNNVIPIYGNSFFERIIDYNINFKIVDLHENLHYGISKTMLYYHTLSLLNSDINNLPLLNVLKHEYEPSITIVMPYLLLSIIFFSK